MYAILIHGERQLKYLQHIFESYTRAGISPDELGEAAHLHHALSSASVVPMPEDQPLHVGKAKIANVSPNGISLDIETETTED